VLALGGSDCEALRAAWLGQPVNSLTSLAYVAAGAYVLRRGGPAGPALALGAVGIGSVLYHGPMPPGAEVVHDGSIAVLVGALLAGAWRRRRSLPRPPVPALVALGAAVAVNLLSRTGAPLCRPGSLVQGHGAWHVLTAVAVGAWLVCWPSPGSARRVPAPIGTTAAASGDTGSGDAVAGADAGRDPGAG
jgi:MYXO-CTERM domain-containing protein